MSNIIEFQAKSIVPEHVVTLTIGRTPDKLYEVSMEVGELEDNDIFEAILAAAFKFAEDHELLDEEDEDHTERT